jgi:hypothetical protein
MDKDKSIRKGIIASVIASVIFMIILEPLMKLFWTFLNNTTNHLYTSYLNSIFTNAAIGHRNHIDFITYYFETVLIFGVLFISLIKAKSIIRKRTDEERKYNLKSKEELEQEISNTKHKLSKLIKALRVLFYSGLVFGFIFMLFMLSSLFKEYANLQLNSTFSQRINALAPYIEDKQQKIFISKWALMKSKEDYLEIKLSLENIAKENNVKLPEELIKY